MARKAPMSEAALIRYRDRYGVEVATRFTRRGLGSAVVLVHGVGMQASVWARQLEFLSLRYDAIAYDMLGHGGSSLPLPDAKLSDLAECMSSGIRWARWWRLNSRSPIPGESRASQH